MVSMSYVKRTPCQKYFDKSNKDGLNKSLSTTRFVPFRRSSDTTSDSGSDEFKLVQAEESSSFSRSSSESCHSYGTNARYHCILKDLNEINSIDKELHNESLNDFRSRLNLRRKIKARDALAYQEDDRTDNSCDSTTTKAHEEILRSANLLKQEKVERTDSGYNGKKTMFHKDTRECSFNTRYTQAETVDKCSKRSEEENLLMNQFDKILQLPDEDEDKLYEAGPSSANSITRSSTETFLAKCGTSKTSTKGVMSSPRIRRKTHSQVLKAASSIPSLIFSNKSLKLQKSSNQYKFEPQTHEKCSSPKKTCMDDDFFSAKARRSPLRFLGNFVDDKIFRGRWSSTKRAKSTDEITWALKNEDLMQRETQMFKDSGRNRKKSFGVMSTNSLSSNNTDSPLDKSYQAVSSSSKSKTISNELTNKKIIDESCCANKEKQTTTAQVKAMELKKKRKSSNTSSDMLSMSGSSGNSISLVGDHFGHSASVYQKKSANAHLPVNDVVRAETLAEIEAFEELLENHLQN